MSKQIIWKYIPEEGEQFLFMHIPKTGGTTLRRMLTKHFRDEDVYPTEFHLMLNGRKYVRQPILIRNRPDILAKPLVMGHYNARLWRHISPDAKIILFLRDPMARLVSHVKHLISKDPDYKHGDPNLVIEDRFDTLTNLQARIMGYTHAKPNMGKVLANLEKVAFVGIQEKFDESIEKLNEQFDWKLDYQKQKNNVSSNNFVVPITEENLTKIKERILPEYQLYNRALEIFEGE